MISTYLVPVLSEIPPHRRLLTPGHRVSRRLFSACWLLFDVSLKIPHLYCTFWLQSDCIFRNSKFCLIFLAWLIRMIFSFGDTCIARLIQMISLTVGLGRPGGFILLFLIKRHKKITLNDRHVLYSIGNLSDGISGAFIPVPSDC